MIGQTITIKGDIVGEENLIIEGKVEGSVTLKSKDLTIGPSGRVIANVTADVVRVDGDLRGDITGLKKVILSKTGKVRGNIAGPRVTLEEGALFKGSIDMDPGGQVAPDAPHPGAESATAGKPPASEPETEVPTAAG